MQHDCILPFLESELPTDLDANLPQKRWVKMYNPVLPILSAVLKNFFIRVVKRKKWMMRWNRRKTCFTNTKFHGLLYER